MPGTIVESTFRKGRLGGVVSTAFRRGDSIEASCHYRGMDEEREARAADLGDDERETAYDLLQRGQALLEGRHFAQAAILLERADRLEPAKGSILEALGRARFNSGQAEPARATFEALLEVEPSSPYAHYAIGQSLKRLGRTDRARTHLRLAVALSPHDALYSAALARLGPRNQKADVSAGEDLET